ncbi:FtsX-like permease family protein [Roseburia inulinivorans]|uniref:ABC transporter permease n=1 Tax=Roseburia inulinivorans TaxID=360807 RepID=UPI001C01B263|nr:ABC transporter permease [Roseburia inulinivorans]MBT9647295.1 FtsX-like permease family protein [Roseburia inulinivorans]
MRSYLSLVPISAKVHKRQSRMTRICIILAVFLVTSIFSMAEMWTDAETTAMRHNHGDWHIALQNVSKDEAEQIRKNSNVAVSSWYDEINTDAEQNYYIDGKNAVLYGIEESYITDIMKYPTEGVYPQNENEVALSADAKELFSVKIGDEITLDTPVGDVKYTISGFYEDDTEFNDIIGGCCVFMNRKTFDEIRRLNGVESESQFYIRFQNENGLKKTIADMMQQYNLTAENVKENTAVLGMLGASSNESVNELYPLAAACFVIILIAGVFMISSCMNSNVAQRTKFFGMMRCIGASKQQIIRFVRLEALNWCKTAIPIGCALGTVTCWILCAILRFFVKGEWVDMPLFAVSINGILCGALVGVITVFIAAHSPAKQAAMVSPAAAVSGNADMSKNVNHAAKTRFLKVETSLGIHHATGTKKNLFLMTGSFALMIVLFLAFSACLDFVHKLLPSVTSKFTPDITIASQDDTNSLDGNLPDKIAEIEGVESAFGMMTRTAFSVEVNGNETEIDLFSHDKTLLDTFKKSVISGDISRVYEDGNYAIAVYNQDYRLSVGDKIKTGNQELEIVCVTSEGVGSVSGAPTVVCSEKTFMRLTGECRFAMISVVLKKDVSEAAVSKIRDLVGDCLFVDNRKENSDINGSYWVFRIASYGFLAIISLITVLNITNSISMGVSARIKQYGAMRAVGMGSGQVAKMITAEAVTYAICGTAAGIILGLLLHYLIYAKIVITHFGGSWNIPFATIAIVLLLVVFSCIVAIYAPAKRIRNMAITATINEL